ncbi:DUF4157 domain-containing protein [Streptosporangiaceae bacterium NEAU-GS5]|nr:DUF4157 domain-containing protein [Streptosporangiaceae bacterium NEAU-GS5]
MEARLGADFSDVRVHTDAAARLSAAAMDARAYTSGSHVVLGEGGTDQRTLAHELIHVIQQRQGPVAGVDDGRGLKISDPADPFEREAEANADVARSTPARTSRAAATPGNRNTVVQRRPEKEFDDEKDRRYVDPNYPGLRLIKIDELSGDEPVYQIANTQEYVVYVPDSNYGYARYDEGLKTYYALVNDQVAPAKAQQNLRGHFTPRSQTTYHYNTRERTVRTGPIESISDFATFKIEDDQLVEVSVALLQRIGKGREDTVAKVLKGDHLENVKVGMINQAAIDPLVIVVSGESITISEGNHRLKAAADLNYKYVPCIVTMQ